MRSPKALVCGLALLGFTPFSAGAGPRRVTVRPARSAPVWFYRAPAHRGHSIRGKYLGGVAIREGWRIEPRYLPAGLPRLRTPEDPAVVDARVVDFLRQRIDEGSVDARYDLAVRHLEGRGVEQSQPAALTLLRQAAARGHRPAATLLRTLAGAYPELPNGTDVGS